MADYSDQFETDDEQQDILGKMPAGMSPRQKLLTLGVPQTPSMPGQQDQQEGDPAIGMPAAQQAYNSDTDANPPLTDGPYGQIVRQPQPASVQPSGTIGEQPKPTGVLPTANGPRQGDVPPAIAGMEDQATVPDEEALLGSMPKSKTPPAPQSTDVPASSADTDDPKPSLLDEKKLLGGKMDAAKQIEAMGARPSNMEDLAKNPTGPQAHHGWRKAGDIAAAIGLGAATMNPAAGVGTYLAMSRDPLRKAQATYDGQIVALGKQAEQQKELEQKQQDIEKFNAEETNKFTLANNKTPAAPKLYTNPTEAWTETVRAGFAKNPNYDPSKDPIAKAYSDQIDSQNADKQAGKKPATWVAKEDNGIVRGVYGPDGRYYSKNDPRLQSDPTLKEGKDEIDSAVAAHEQKKQEDIDKEVRINNARIDAESRAQQRRDDAAARSQYGKDRSEWDRKVAVTKAEQEKEIAKLVATANSDAKAVDKDQSISDPQQKVAKKADIYQKQIAAATAAQQKWQLERDKLGPEPQPPNAVSAVRQPSPAAAPPSVATQPPPVKSPASAPVPGRGGAAPATTPPPPPVEHYEAVNSSAEAKAKPDGAHISINGTKYIKRANGLEPVQ